MHQSYPLVVSSFGSRQTVCPDFRACILVLKGRGSPQEGRGLEAFGRGGGSKADLWLQLPAVLHGFAGMLIPDQPKQR